MLTEGEAGASLLAAEPARVLAWSRMAEALRSQPWAISLSLLPGRGVGVTSRGTSSRLAKSGALAMAFLRLWEGPGRRDGLLLELEPDSITLCLAACSSRLTQTPS